MPQFSSVSDPPISLFSGPFRKILLTCFIPGRNDPLRSFLEAVGLTE